MSNLEKQAISWKQERHGGNLLSQITLLISVATLYVLSMTPSAEAESSNIFNPSITIQDESMDFTKLPQQELETIAHWYFDTWSNLLKQASLNNPIVAQREWAFHRLVTMYSSHVVFEPTKAPIWTWKEFVKNYFSEFLRSNPVWEVINGSVKVVTRDMLLYTWTYQFTLNNSKTIEARYAYLFKQNPKSPTGFSIVFHESSAIHPAPWAWENYLPRWEKITITPDWELKEALTNEEIRWWVVDKIINKEDPNWIIIRWEIVERPNRFSIRVAEIVDWKWSEIYTHETLTPNSHN